MTARAHPHFLAFILFPPHALQPESRQTRARIQFCRPYDENFEHSSHPYFTDLWRQREEGEHEETLLNQLVC